MRTKDEIIRKFADDGLACASEDALSILAAMNVLEVLIDTRDILNEKLSNISLHIRDMVEKD